MSQSIDSAALRLRLEQAGIRRTYTIAFTPRCGSTALSNALAHAGVGCPTEYFQYPYDAQSPFGRAPSGDFSRDIEALVRERSANGIFGAKIMHDHRAHLDDWLESSVARYATLDDVLPNHRWIYIRREDSIAQAVSLYIADESGIWHMPTDADTDVPEPDIRYDFLAILAKLTMLLSHEANWDAYFRKTGIQPLRTSYEALSAAPAPFLEALAAHLDVPADRLADVQLTRTGRLNKISDRFADVYRNIRERFTTDFLAIGRRDNRATYGPDLDRWVQFFGNHGWREGERR
ncbi:Stf0 sulfotransferase family protein [Burkholderia multivorans]|uniref:Stf0 family sulfotransferase n=1 Tax=Burkholderia multivorans TaxID=87883 RepID=UPI001C22B060|nr:Stf0 family sulfotransferase [Burkholderia multivorans]MBU9232469.1 Stf0 sulfotransferase family protein [Burkholderia multivorans]